MDQKNNINFWYTVPNIDKTLKKVTNFLIFKFNSPIPIITFRKIIMDFYS